MIRGRFHFVSARSFVTYLVIGLWSAHVYAGQNYTLTQLTPPGESPLPSVRGVGITSWGLVVGTYVDNTNGYTHGFVKSASGTYTTLDPPGSIHTSISGVTDTSRVFGWSYDANEIATNFYVDLKVGKFVIVQPPKAPPPSPTGIPSAYLTAANNSGLVAGYYYDTNIVPHGFFFDGKNYAAIDAPGATMGTLLVTINDKWEAGGSYTTSDGKNHGYTYVGGKFQTVDPPNSNFTNTIVTSINNVGDVVGNFTDTTGKANGFLLRGGKYTIIAPPNALSTNVNAINDNGVIVGGFATTLPNGSKGTLGFTLTSEGYAVLNFPFPPPPNANVYNGGFPVVAVNSLGWIVANYGYITAGFPIGQDYQYSYVGIPK